MRNKILFLLFALLAAMPADAQRYAYRASFRGLTKDGFYKILITPEITAHTTADGHDIRIVAGESGKELPYLRGENKSVGQGSFHPFDILSNGKAADGHTHIILRNDAAWPVGELYVPTRNTTAIRKASVSGSRDGQHFFSLIDSAMLDATYGGRGDTVTCILQIPETTYPFLQITIFDNGLLPLDVLGVGIHRDSLLGPKYVDVPEPSFEQKDSSDHRSYIRLHFDMPYRVDRLGFLFGGAHFFKRTATLYSGGMAVAHFTADQAVPATVRTELHTKDALLVVENEDSPPLRLQSVSASQLEQYLLAYFEADVGYRGHDYALTFGDSALPAPVYDLRYFKDSISRLTLPELRPDTIMRVQIASGRKAEKHSPLLGKGAMWAIIILVLAGLIAATVALMRQIKQRT